MATSKKKSAGKSNRKKSSKKEILRKPPKTIYPVSPHVVGIEWIDWPVSKPALTEMYYVALGFTWRGRLHGKSLLSIGAVVLRLVRSRRPVKMSLQMTVDQVRLKHKQATHLGLNTTRVRRQKRGDEMFVCSDPDGHELVIVGPTRLGADPNLD
jgi:hypothetical protein